MSSRNHAHYYATIAGDQRDDYLAFRELHRFQSRIVNGVAWEYIDTGTSSEDTTPLLILVGGLRVADAAYRAITILKTDRRVIIPSYPPLMTMSALTDGMVGLLQALHLDRVDVLSGSFGGMVAQALIQWHPGHIRNVVLSSTGLMTESAIRQRKKTLSIMRLLPDWVVRCLTERRLFSIINPPVIEKPFWRAYLKELFAERLTKADVLSTLACMIDLGENFAWTGGESGALAGNVLIIGSVDDPTFGADGHQSLLTIFPSARVHTFTNAGHSPSMTATDDYFGRIREFLNTSDMLLSSRYQ